MKVVFKWIYYHQILATNICLGKEIDEDMSEDTWMT
jgi:hypothetical protein